MDDLAPVPPELPLSSENAELEPGQAAAGAPGGSSPGGSPPPATPKSAGASAKKRKRAAAAASSSEDDVSAYCPRCVSATADYTQDSDATKARKAKIVRADNAGEDRVRVVP